MFRSLLARLGGGDRVAIADPLWQAAVERFAFLSVLEAADRARLRALAEALLADKQMAAAGGLELSAQMQVVIAAQASLPILNLGIDWYRGWTGIVVYPAEFVVPRAVADDDGIVHEYDDAISGEAWDGGPLILSWADIESAGDASASAAAWSYNVVIHEFTHKLDMLNGDADGLPPFDRNLHPHLGIDAWRAALDDAFERFNAELELIAAELPPGLDPDAEEANPYYARLPLDPYAGESESEFFAVSSEQFFVDPARLQQAFPVWYEQLALFFRQNPMQHLAPAQRRTT